MSFYTSLTGLNASQADLAAISNNIANVGTTGFKLSTAQFGDIFANSPLQNANAAVGSGTILKKVQQEFTQGNIESSQNSLDMAISGQGFFALKPSLTSTQTVYTRNGTFTVNNNNYIVDSQGEYLQGFPVNSDGSVIATDASSAINLQIPSTSGLPKATSNIELGLNLPANATIIPDSSTYTASNPYVFDHTNPATYNQSTSITIYDSLGNPTIATIYYVKTANATSSNPTNTWQTHVFVGDKEVDPSLITAKSSQGSTIYINKFGQTTTDPTSVDSSFVPNQPSPLYYQDQQNTTTPSTAAQVQGAIQNLTGFDFGNTDSNTVQIVTDPALYSTTREGGNTAANAPYWGNDMFTVSVDGSQPQSISINAGTYNGEQLAAEMTRAVNAKFSSANYFRITDTYRDPGGSVVAGNDVFDVNLSKTNTDGSTSTLNPPLEIDLLGTAGAAGTPASGGSAQQLNYQDLTQQQLIDLAQTKINDALNARHDEFGKNSDWVDPSNPPIKVGFDVSTNSLTFTADPSQLGADATLPQNRYDTIQVYNPTSSTNDLGIPSQTSSTAATISASTSWTGLAVSPNGPPILDAADQRTGIQVSYNKNSDQFTFSSGTTGETSSIEVGRAQLATINDVQPQINSYDLSNLSLQSGQSFTLESDGKQFTYTVPYLSGGGIQTVSGTQDTPTSTPPNLSVTTFLNDLQQAMPVSFTTTNITNEGTPTSAEVQSFTPYGNLLNGDQFNLSLQENIDSSSSTLANVSVGPLTGLAGLTPNERIAKLATAIQSALTNAKDANGSVDLSSSVKVSVNANNPSQIDISYLSNGAVSSTANIVQTTRGVADGITPTSSNVINFTDQTVDPTPATELTSGNAKTAEVQSVTMQSSTIGDQLKINEGDQYTLSVPQSDGTVTTKTVTVGAPGGTSALLSALNGTSLGSGPFGSVVTFSNPTGTNDLVMTYNTPGSITGTFTITQTAVGVASTTTPTTYTTTQVRPQSIGPFSISGSGTLTGGRLLVEGNPDGSSFHLNILSNGQVVQEEPQGAIGSKTQAGREIGQSMATTADAASFFSGSNDLLGVGTGKSQTSIAGTGLASTPAVATGSTAITPMNQTFLLNASLGENVMTVTVDGITGTINLPISSYTGDTFAAAIQQRINQIQDPSTGDVVSGVTVKYDSTNNRLIFTSGTQGSTSQINVVGSANFGLSNVTQTPGSVPSITVLQQATDANGNKLYVDANGNITTQEPTTKLQDWSPLYLTPGELTFNTAGNLQSPIQGVVYSPFDPGNGSNPLNLTINYGKLSTQYNQSFSVNSLTQDGYPSGSLNGLSIDSSGTVTASYTNGQSTALGKVMIANFANQNGLKQVGNTNYVATAASGNASLGQAGSNGFGSIQAGALEQSNVDITQELVNLITAQRNFQANAKAIETDTSLTQTIVQIRE